MAYADAELEAMLADLESDIVEQKESFRGDAPRAAREAADGAENLKPESDPHCLATLKHFRSLIPLAQEARKPIFDLTVADGAIGSHAQATRVARSDFQSLAGRILAAMSALEPAHATTPEQRPT